MAWISCHDDKAVVFVGRKHKEGMKKSQQVGNGGVISENINLSKERVGGTYAT